MFKKFVNFLSETPRINKFMIISSSWAGATWRATPISNTCKSAVNKKKQTFLGQATEEATTSILEENEKNFNDKVEAKDDEGPKYTTADGPERMQRSIEIEQNNMINEISIRGNGIVDGIDINAIENLSTQKFEKASDYIHNVMKFLPPNYYKRLKKDQIRGDEFRDSTEKKHSP